MNNQISLPVVFICYCLFFYLGIVRNRNSKITGINFLRHRKHTSDLNIRHWQGIILLGLPLLLFFNKWATSLKWPENLSTKQALVFFAILLVVLSIAAKSAYTKQLVFSRDMVKETNVIWPRVYNYFIFRILFLITYECFFRGILLIVCLGSFGVGWALAINILLYAGIHIINGTEQVLASVLLVLRYACSVSPGSRCGLPYCYILYYRLHMSVTFSI